MEYRPTLFGGPLPIHAHLGDRKGKTRACSGAGDGHGPSRAPYVSFCNCGRSVVAAAVDADVLHRRTQELDHPAPRMGRVGAPRVLEGVAVAGAALAHVVL